MSTRDSVGGFYMPSSSPNGQVVFPSSPSRGIGIPMPVPLSSSQAHLHVSRSPHDHTSRSRSRSRSHSHSHSHSQPPPPMVIHQAQPQVHHHHHHKEHASHHHHRHHHHSHSHSHAAPQVVHVSHSNGSQVQLPAAYPAQVIQQPQPNVYPAQYASRPPREHRSHSASRPVAAQNYRVSSAPAMPVPEFHPPPLEPQPFDEPSDRSVDPAHRPLFQYSQCTGKKKALCIGINYRGEPHALKGCVNDAKSVRQFIMRQYHYKAEDIRLLTDDGRTSAEKPTRDNIIEGMRWLVYNAHPHDSLFFHYSGHGGQTKDLDGDEADGYDEVIYPLDFKQKGHIVDDLMFELMVRPLPTGCRLTAIFDSCHSGTALDLPYIYNHRGRMKTPNIFSSRNGGFFPTSTKRAGDVNNLTRAFNGLMRSGNGGQDKALLRGARAAQKAANNSRASTADVISFSGCKDSQTSADTEEAGEAVGAMSYAFMSTLKQKPNQSYAQLLFAIRDILRRRYSQIPQLSSSHPIDTTVQFIA